MSKMRPAWHLSQLKEIKSSLVRARNIAEEQGLPEIAQTILGQIEQLNSLITAKETDILVK